MELQPSGSGTLPGTQAKPRPKLAVSQRCRRLHAGKPLLFLFGCFAFGPAAAGPPAWWRAGRSRSVHRSAAEVELLSHLAVLLMPRQSIGELFREFPVEPSEGWGARWLCPDLSAFGSLSTMTGTIGTMIHRAAHRMNAKRKRCYSGHLLVPVFCVLDIHIGG